MKERSEEGQKVVGEALGGGVWSCARHPEGRIFAACPSCGAGMCEACALAPEESLCPSCEDRDFAALVGERMRALRVAGAAAMLALPFAAGLKLELYITAVAGRPTGGLAFLAGLGAGLFMDGGVVAQWLAARRRFQRWAEEGSAALEALHEEAHFSRERDLESEREAVFAAMESGAPRVLSREDLAWTEGPYPGGILCLGIAAVSLALGITAGFDTLAATLSFFGLGVLLVGGGLMWQRLGRP